MIEIENITFRHQADDLPIVNNLRFQIERGSCLGLTGESGIGKSTIAGLIAGHLKPASGQVVINGLCHDKPSRKIFLMSQTDDLFPWQKVLAQITFAQKIPNEERSLELLSLVKLNGVEDKYPRELSGGMKKRLSLARALAIEPDLLILDEAFSSLNIELKKELYQDLLICLKKLGTTTLIITHDQADIKNLANREIQLAPCKPTHILKDLHF